MAEPAVIRVPRMCPGCGSERFQHRVTIYLVHHLGCPVVAHEERYDDDPMELTHVDTNPRS